MMVLHILLVKTKDPSPSPQAENLLGEWFSLPRFCWMWLLFSLVAVVACTSLIFARGNWMPQSTCRCCSERDERSSATTAGGS
jgi:hypothetical protein